MFLNFLPQMHQIYIYTGGSKSLREIQKLAE